MATPSYVIVDVYRDGFLLRRETLGAGAAAFAIGSSPEARLWLDSTRVAALHALLEIDQDGRAILEDRSNGRTFMGRRRIAREELFRGAPITIPPFVLVVAKRPNDPDPAEPQRVFPPPPPGMNPHPTPLPVPGRGRLKRAPPPKPDPGPPEGSCPRCATTLSARALSTAGPAYRTAPAQALACPHCSLLLVAAADLVERMPLRGRLADTPAVRRRNNARGLCPTCRADLQSLTLSWGESWVVVEECGGCGLVAFDPRELEVVAQIVAGLAG